MEIPGNTRLDSTRAFLSDGYRFISRRCERYGTDIFETRLLLRRAFCMMGEDAARMFYIPGRFTRRGALPPTTVRLLQDRGSVQLQDGEAHVRRKAMFMSLMTPDALRRAADLMDEEWRISLGQWAVREEVALHDEVEEILCRTAFRWTGIPLTESEARARTRELAAMINGAGTVGLRYWQGRRLRARTERWLRGKVQQARRLEIRLPESSAAYAIAWHRDLDGSLLDSKIAAVEILNVLRPTVAVARFVTFAALALHEHPETRRRLEAGDDDYLQWFVHEVRRYYPFFPAVGARAQEAFEWRGHRFSKGTWFILDLYGTDHDPRTWKDPDAFRPERFRDRRESAFDLTPQGGGDYYYDHRCAGEWLTIELMKRAVSLLVTAMRYDVPRQDLSIDFSRMPAIPRSHFVIRNVERLRQVADKRELAHA